MHRKKIVSIPESTLKKIRTYAWISTQHLLFFGLLYIGLYGFYVYGNDTPSCFSVSDFGIQRPIYSVFEWGLVLVGWSFPIFLMLYAFFLGLHIYRKTPIFTKTHNVLILLTIHMQCLITALICAANGTITYKGLIPISGMLQSVFVYSFNWFD